MGGHWCPTAQPPPASDALLVGLRDDDESGTVCASAAASTGYSGSRNRRAYTTRSIPIEHARAQVARVTRRRPAREGSRRVGRLRGHRLARARTRTHSRHNDHLWRATGRGSAAGPPRPRHQPAFDSAEANPRDTQTLRDFLMAAASWSFNPLGLGLADARASLCFQVQTHPTLISDLTHASKLERHIHAGLSWSS